MALYRDTEGATITVIAAELGVSEATLSAWCKAAGVPIRHRKPGSVREPAPGTETLSRSWPGCGHCVPDGDRVNHKRVARVMRGVGIAALPPATPGQDHGGRSGQSEGPDLLNRDFTAEALNTRYVGDITYLPLAPDGRSVPGHGDRLLLAAGHRVVIAEHMRTELVEDALKAAAALRGSLAGAVFHSDHGSQGVFYGSLTLHCWLIGL